MLSVNFKNINIPIIDEQCIYIFDTLITTLQQP
jgi:hypothetical protein